MTTGGDDRIQTPTLAGAAELLRWRPRHGVLSIYVDADPADRGGRWRIELRDDLDRAIADAGRRDRETRFAVEATAKRITDDLIEPGDARPRGLIGFVEAARERGEDRWYAAQIPPRRTEAGHGPRPRIGPLIALLDDGAPLGVVAVSAERIRLFHWQLGRIEEIHDWEVELPGLDWRERRSPRSRDPAAAQVVKAAGRDQHNQRLEANRERFAHESGGLVRTSARELAWRQVLAFGDDRYVRPLAQGFGAGGDLRHVDAADLVPQPTSLIGARIAELLPALNRDREQALIARVKEAAFSEGRSAFGEQETLQALEQGRVEHLLYDSEHDGLELERMVELALSTGAAITPVEGESATRLAEQGGVAALLRY
ncbi:MAG TPA: VLRF1 family aeRF1-type release factor [Solirubrobacterales bacterium]|nr:VLRF1 family aeRF1-type release factor [Solirubrobacterales bacterium]